MSVLMAREDTLAVLGDVIAERVQQEMKWGEQNHDPLYWVGIAMEELGEATREAIEAPRYTGRDDPGNGPRYRRELVHLAAVCVAALESYDRHEAEGGEK